MSNSSALREGSELGRGFSTTTCDRVNYPLTIQPPGGGSKRCGVLKSSLWTRLYGMNEFNKDIRFWPPWRYGAGERNGLRALGPAPEEGRIRVAEYLLSTRLPLARKVILQS